MVKASKCTCIYCEHCRGFGILRDERGEFVQCNVCHGVGIIEYCDYCIEQAADVERILVDVAQNAD